MTGSPPAAIPRLSLIALFQLFLRFGMLAFGGPVAQIAMIRQALVEERRWLSPARFDRLLAVMQALPGPEAHELCVHLGMMARGRIGGLLAGLGFMLPGLLLMLGCGWAYARFVAGWDGMQGLLLGAQVAVLAVIARSVQRIGEHVLGHPGTRGLAVIALSATLAGLPFWVPLGAAAAAPLLAVTPARRLAIAAALVVATAGLWRLWQGATPLPLPGAGGSAAALASVGGLFVAGLKGGLLTFGGAYTAIPYVRADTAGRGWVSEGAFLDGVAIANLLPAPLVIFATFVGYIAAGLAGALAITVGMFLPAFAFSLIFYERLERLIDQPRLQRTLDGVAAAAIGIIAATLVPLAAATWRQLDAPLAAAPMLMLAAGAAWGLRGAWVTPAIIAGGAGLGALLLG